MPEFRSSIPSPIAVTSVRRRDGRLSVRALLGTTLGVATLAGMFAAGVRFGTQQVLARDAWADGRLLSTAIDSVRANALDSLPSDELIRRAVAGMLRELHDPYAALLEPAGYKSYRNNLVGESQGLGLTLRRQGQLLSVRAVADGSPAAMAGMRRGDRVLAWDGVSVDSERNDAHADSARTAADTVRVLLWRAPYGDSVQVTLHRRTWHMPAVVDAGLLSDSVGYARLTSISQNSAGELERAVALLVRRGATSLVLDLRGNGGGLFEEGVKAAGLFLPDNVVVASLAGRGGKAAQVYRNSASRWPTMPITVLVDAATGSAAEVIAAALREHNRALLVGAPTYGKGVVQRVVRLSPELSLKLTTARWLTPTGKVLERRTGKGKDATGGLLPDVLMEDASWRDPSDVPRDWPTETVSHLIATADTAAMRALRDGWSTTPLPFLESRLRQRLAESVPKKLSKNPLGERWLTVATRLATVRMLEVDGPSYSLLRYAMREDAAIRAGFEVLAPGSNVVSLQDASALRESAPSVALPK